MTDIVTYCDVNTCEDCPRYGDDCDGDKRVEHTDYISRADAIEAVQKIVPYVIDKDTGQWGILVNKANVITELSALPSADAPKGDLISRQWLLELYGDYIGDNGEPKYHVPLEVVRQNIKDAPSADAEPKRVLQGYNKGANTIQTIRHEELTQIANTRKAVESADATIGDYPNDLISRSALMEYCSNQKSKSIDNNDIARFPSADAVPQLKQTDTLIIADALRYLAKDTERHLVDRTRADALRQQFLKYGASMCKGGDDE